MYTNQSIINVNNDNKRYNHNEKEYNDDEHKEEERNKDEQKDKERNHDDRNDDMWKYQLQIYIQVFLTDAKKFTRKHQYSW